MGSVKGFNYDLGRLDLHYIIWKHRIKFYWQLINWTSNFMHDIQRCYFGNNFLYDTKFVVMSTGVYISVKCIHEHSQASCVVCFFSEVWFIFSGFWSIFFRFISDAIRRNKVFKFIHFLRVWRHLMLMNDWWAMTVMSQTIN